MSNIDQTTQMLILVLVCAFVVLLVLCFVYFMLKRKDDNKWKIIEYYKRTIILSKKEIKLKATIFTDSFF